MNSLINLLEPLAETAARRWVSITLKPGTKRTLKSGVGSPAAVVAAPRSQHACVESRVAPVSAELAAVCRLHPVT